MWNALCKYRGFRIVFALLLWVLLSQTLSAQIPATDDSYTASSSATSNFGNQSMLNVIGPGVNSYIRFDLTALPAGLTSSNVSKATMRLNINGVTTAGTFDVYLVTSSWTEGALTFNNAPTLGAKVASAIMIPVSKRNFIDVDVTSAVQAWLTSPNPAPNYGVALVPSSGSSISVSFDSKENTSTSHDSELSVALISAGPQGPQGIQGLQGIQGIQGIQGPLGPQGATGATGASGATGATGAQGPPGPQGIQGVPGATGATGPQGPAGADGAQGPAGPGFNLKGSFDGNLAYAAYDVVSFNGSSYVTKSAVSAGDPAPDSNPNWNLLAQQGAVGPAGTIGPLGPPGPVGPQGPQGIQGLQGAQGPPGTAGGNPRMFFSAFAPGPLNTAYTPTSVIPDQPVSVTRLTVNFKSFPGPCNSPAVIRVTDGTTGQDVKVNPTAAASDSGPSSYHSRGERTSL